jgi:L-2,4-diaminobutyrate transaminase
VATAQAVLDIVERESVIERAAATGSYLQKRMHELFDDLPIVGEVRGVGMLAAIEFVQDRATKSRFDPAMKVGARVSKAARDRNLIARAMPHGDILGFAPPLIMSTEEVDEMLDITLAAVHQVMGELARERAIA